MTYKSEKYNMLFPKKIDQKSKVKGNSWSFIAISLAKGARDICHFNSIASPSVLGTAFVQISFPSYCFKSMLLRWWIRKAHFRGGILSHSDHTRVQEQAVPSVGHDTGDKYSRDLAPQDNYCPTFGSDRHRGLGWGFKCKDQIKESSLWILPTSPPCHAPKASQGFAMDAYKGIKSSS